MRISVIAVAIAALAMVSASGCDSGSGGAGDGFPTDRAYCTVQAVAGCDAPQHVNAWECEAAGQVWTDAIMNPVDCALAGGQWIDTHAQTSEPSSSGTGGTGTGGTGTGGTGTGGTGTGGTGDGGTGDGPGTTTLAALGSACGHSSECAGESCLPDTYPNGSPGFPDGYCTQVCSGLCPEGSQCVDLGGGAEYCLSTCSADTECRDGYICGEAGNCWPDCNTFACATGETCSESGHCVDPNDPGTGSGGGHTVPGGPTPEGCDVSGFASVSSQVSSPQSGIVQWAAVNNSADPYDVLLIELYQGNPYNGATGPGTYDLAGTNYADCGNCVRIRTQCSQATGQCQKDFYADSGTLEITAFDGSGFAGVFHNVVLKEVTINNDTFVSTPVAGGQTWCIDGLSFSEEISGGGPTPGGPSAGDFPVYEGEVSDTCVANGNGNLINANIADFTLTNCNGDPVSLHQGCGKKAIWLISVGGW